MNGRARVWAGSPLLALSLVAAGCGGDAEQSEAQATQSACAAGKTVEVPQGWTSDVLAGGDAVDNDAPILRVGSFPLVSKNGGDPVKEGPANGMLVILQTIVGDQPNPAGIDSKLVFESGLSRAPRGHAVAKTHVRVGANVVAVTVDSYTAIPDPSRVQLVDTMLANIRPC